jgi:hypothetical protein
MNEEVRSTSGVDLPAKPPRRRRTWWRWLALVLLLAGGVALWAGWSPRLPRGPVHLVRDPQGQLMPATDQDSDGSELHWEAQAGAIQAQNNLSSSSTSARSRRARFACRRLAIVCRSPHELMQRVGPCLLEHLKKLRGFEHVAYYPVGKTPEPGALSPDGIVEIEMDSIGESGLMPVRTLEATIRVTASCGLMRSSNYYSGPLDPPCVDWNFEAALEHHSTTTGVGTPSSRYKLAAQNIGQQLGEALVKYLNEMHDKDGPLPLLPDAFYPPYKPPPELPRPPEVTAELRASSHGLMNANETLWRLDTQRTTADVLTELQKRLTDAGWTTNSRGLPPDAEPFLRMERESAVITVYCEPHRPTPLIGTTSVATRPDASAPGPNPRPLFVHHIEWMNSEQIAAALDGLFASDASVESLLCFEHGLNEAQRDRLLQRFQDQPPRSPDAWLVLAELHHAAKRTDAACDALQRAALLLRTVSDPGELRKRTEELAKKLGQEAPPDAVPDPQLLGELGFTEIRPGIEIPDRQLALDEPALFFVRHAEGHIETLTLRIEKTGNGPDPLACALAHVHSAKQGRSWGSGGLIYHLSLDGSGTVTFQAEPIDDRPTFRLTARASAGTSAGSSGAEK